MTKTEMIHQNISLTILIGMCFLIIGMMAEDAWDRFGPDEPDVIEIHDDFAEPLRIHQNEVCADVVLRSPGGLTHHTGLVCYNTELGWIEMNVQYLTDEKYAALVQPKKDSLRHIAQQKGLYDSGHDLNWYIRGGI